MMNYSVTTVQLIGMVCSGENEKRKSGPLIVFLHGSTKTSLVIMVIVS